MIIDSLIIRNFRNKKYQEIHFSNKKNLIHGLNGAGKTSILEAIFLSGFGKSFLNVKKSEIVKYGTSGFNLSVNIDSSKGTNVIDVVYTNQNFRLLLNGKKINIFDITEYLYPVYFSSSNYNYYVESRTYLRRLIDQYIFGVNPLYLHYILGYNKTLKQKKNLLKSGLNISQLNSWNKVLSEMGAKIVKLRREFIDKLNFEITENFHNRLFINYEPSAGKNLENGEEGFYSELLKIQNMEIIQKRPLIGPHKDLFEINLNNKNLKYFSSGEKKIHLLMIYISFIELYHSIQKDYPVFLVDDYDTAIDDKNIKFLMDNYPDIQVIATSVNCNDVFDNLIELEKEN